MQATAVSYNRAIRFVIRVVQWLRNIVWFVEVPVVGEGFAFSIPNSFNMSVTYAVGMVMSMKLTVVCGFSSPSTFNRTSFDSCSVKTLIRSGFPHSGFPHTKRSST